MSALSWLKPLTATVVVAGTLLVAAPVRAQEVTVLRGSPSSPPTAAIDCNDPNYAQYCQAYAAWQNQYYPTYDYGDAYPYYDYGVPVGVGRFGFFHHRGNFHEAFHGGFHGGGFHGGGFHGGGFHGGGHR